MKRSKVSQIPNLVPAKPIGVRESFRRHAQRKADKAEKRHGLMSYQFERAAKSRWL